MLIQAYKCVKTNKLFETEAAFKRHLVGLARVEFWDEKRRQRDLARTRHIKEFQALDELVEMEKWIENNFTRIRHYVQFPERKGTIASLRFHDITWKDTGWKAEIKVKWKTPFDGFLSDVLRILGIDVVRNRHLLGNGDDSIEVFLPAKRFQNLYSKIEKSFVERLRFCSKLSFENRLSHVQEITRLCNEMYNRRFCLRSKARLPCLNLNLTALGRVQTFFPEFEVAWLVADWRAGGDTNLSIKVMELVQKKRLIRVKSAILTTADDAIWLKMSGYLPRDIELIKNPQHEEMIEDPEF